MSEPRVLGAGEGESYVLIGSEHITFKKRGSRGEGCSIFEDATQAGYQGPPLHFHRNQNEDFYVLEGHFEFRVDDRMVEGGPGTFVHSPKGSVAHPLTDTGNLIPSTS